MGREIVMPHLSDAVEEGILVTWFVEPGATVREGDLIAEVQVEKMSSEIHAPAAGRIGDLLAQPGGVVRQGDAITTLEPEEGAIGAAAPAPAAQAPAAAPAPVSPPGGRIEPLSPMRATIAERLRTGLASTAQLTLTAEADVTGLAGELARLSEVHGLRLSYTEAIVRACGLALREHPRVAARLSGSSLAHPDRIDIGVAVALDDGLVVPVIRDADRKDLPALNAEIAELAERARSGRLAPADTEGGCFSVTNLGAYRIDAFTPLLNPPQTAILGVGRGRPRPAIVADAIVARTLVVLSLTFDHQVVDGAPAAAFLDAIVGLLESPERLGLNT